MPEVTARGIREMREDEGFTLVELLVVIILLGVIGGITLAASLAAMRTQRQAENRTAQLTAVETALERITKDIRVADPLVAADAQDLTLDVFHNGACEQRRYYVSGGQLLMSTQAWPTSSACATKSGSLGSATTQVLVSQVVTGSSPLFSYARVDAVSDEVVQVASPVAAGAVSQVRRVDVTVVAALQGGHPNITLSSGVDLRNGEGS